jgi:hypothetical protein
MAETREDAQLRVSLRSAAYRGVAVCRFSLRLAVTLATVMNSSALLRRHPIRSTSLRVTRAFGNDGFYRRPPRVPAGGRASR